MRRLPFLSVQTITTTVSSKSPMVISRSLHYPSEGPVGLSGSLKSTRGASSKSRPRSTKVRCLFLRSYVTFMLVDSHHVTRSTHLHSPQTAHPGLLKSGPSGPLKMLPSGSVSAGLTQPFCIYSKCVRCQYLYLQEYSRLVPQRENLPNSRWQSIRLAPGPRPHMATHPFPLRPRFAKRLGKSRAPVPGGGAASPGRSLGRGKRI
jgi:hypothetical protein